MFSGASKREALTLVSSDHATPWRVISLQSHAEILFHPLLLLLFTLLFSPSSLVPFSASRQ